MDPNPTRTASFLRARRYAFRLPPTGTLLWWRHIAVEKIAGSVARVGLVAELRRTTLPALATRGSARRLVDTPDVPPTDVRVAAPVVQIETRPARFEAAIRELVAGYRTSESTPWALSDARVEFPSGLVTVDGVVPEETLTQRIWPHSYQYLPLMKLRRAPAERIDPGCVFTYAHWNNLYHWLAVMLPLGLMLHEATELKLYVPRSAPRFATECLSFLGLDGRCLQLDDGIYSSESLVVASIPGHGIDRPSPPHVLRVRNALLERLPHDPTARRRLYISRDDARDRRVLNEDELVGALAGLGFERVTLGTLPFESQLRMFAEAELVIGAHGAGLANAIVGPEGSWLIELVGDKVVNPMYAALASFVGQRYGYVRVVDSYRDHVASIDDVLRAVRVALDDLTSVDGTALAAAPSAREPLPARPQPPE